MNKIDVIATVKKQLAIDYNCKESDFDYGNLVVTEFAQNEGRNMCADNDRAMRAVCFGGAAVFSAKPKLAADLRRIFEGKDPEWIFEANSLIMISEILYLHGHTIDDMHQYYVPDPSLPETEPAYETEWVESGFERFKNDPLAKEALSCDPNTPNMVAVIAKENGRPIAMAGASADSPLLWQIGISVAPEARGKGVAANLVAVLKDRVLKMGKVPYYGSAVSHTLSLSAGVAAGFFPCWTQILSKARTDEFLGMHGTR
ncbi:MAG: GNAT family N-acetyltransferase [Oscillospiraceae bacterium]|nr:GNAT family N-acetyltransferase [Oscillospiraceae bacterium]